MAICRLTDGTRVTYAHLQDPIPKPVFKRGEQIGIVSDILNNDHLHFEMEGVLAGDMPGLFCNPNLQKGGRYAKYGYE